MALDVTSFLARFPEFKRAPLDLIESKITEAELQIDSAVWNTKTDLGAGYLAAHLLALSPFGQHARLVPANMKPTRGEALTTYEREYKRLVKIVASGFRVTGPDQTTVNTPTS